MVATVKDKAILGALGNTEKRNAFFTSNAVDPYAQKTPTNTAGETNKSLLKGLGIDLDTVLTPKGKRKKRAGLRGGDPEELETVLGG
jgi:hypothetical protein